MRSLRKGLIFSSAIVELWNLDIVSVFVLHGQNTFLHHAIFKGVGSSDSNISPQHVHLGGAIQTEELNFSMEK